MSAYKLLQVHWQKWGGVVTITLLLLALALFNYWAVERNQRDIEILSQSDLPLFNEIQSMRMSLVQVESAVYEYYLTTDAERYNSRFKTHVDHVHTTLSHLSAELGDVQQLLDLDNVSRDIETTAQEFSAVMSPSNIDWDEAREVLSRFGPLSARASTESEALSRWVQQRVLSLSQDYSNRVRFTHYLVSVLVVLALVVAIWLARSNYSRLRALREQERLASFPRSNPHPVLSLDHEGNVMFANGAAKSLAINNNLDSLLPVDLYSYLTKNSCYRDWEYQREGRSFHISLGYLPEHGEYHAYLSDISARKKAEEDLEYLAYHDSTTGLINRQQFNDFVDGYLESEHVPLLVAIMDMDLLDKVVAAAGVNVSEAVARIAAMRLQHTITEESYFEKSSLSYVGGGLFCFAYPNDKVQADLIFHRMQETIARPFDVDGFEFYLRLTIGVVTSEHIQNRNSDEALRLADGALQLAKLHGGQQILYYESGIEEQHQYRLAVEHGLRQSIERDELHVYYQPKIDVTTLQITGVEALLRWQHPELGFVSPADFIPIAEDSGQILEIGQWVLDQACDDLEFWNGGRKRPITVAVNISAKQLLYSDIGASVLTATRRNDIPVSWIELEITETAALSDFERALDRLQQLDKLGITLSLDDFGTGFSSLSYLQKLPVKLLKIDRSFVTPLATGSKEEILTESIIRMAQQLKLKVVAEGVETDAQLACLRQWGCEYVQGYYFSKPLPLNELLHFLDDFEHKTSFNGSCQ